MVVVGAKVEAGVGAEVGMEEDVDVGAEADAEVAEGRSGSKLGWAIPESSSRRASRLAAALSGTGVPVSQPAT